MAISDIKCPQPRRPFLKRKASQFASIDGTGKRPRFLSSSIDPIPSLSLRRSRSDTFLARNITPWLNYLDHFRPATAPITSFSSYSSRLDSPFDRSISMPSTDSGPAASPSYRDVLRRHGIYFQTYGDIPPHVKEFALGIIQGERTSPGLSDDQMSQFQRDQFDYSNSDESQTKAFLQQSASLFPLPREYRDQTHQIATGGDIPFDRTALPFNKDSGGPPIVQPRPDLHFGYSATSFSDSEDRAMKQPRLAPYAQPNTANYWPFFAVEFRSLSRGGTSWVAQNENAATGSHCVNSITTLLEYCGQHDLPKREIQSLAFSCVADCEGAALWVH